ncbi:MAG: hypothetical protein JWM02_3074 [Frankiales bacterium]|nr:hypothetical protein [Frankiales bacterium]
MVMRFDPFREMDRVAQLVNQQVGTASPSTTRPARSAWACEEILRQLLAAHGPTRHTRHESAHRRTRFLAACAVASMPETTRLAGTIEIEGFLELGITNARTEGCNRVIKEIKRVACGFRDQANYERRIMLHSAALRAA